MAINHVLCSLCLTLQCVALFSCRCWRSNRWPFRLCDWHFSCVRPRLLLGTHPKSECRQWLWAAHSPVHHCSGGLSRSLHLFHCKHGRHWHVDIWRLEEPVYHRHLLYLHPHWLCDELHHIALYLYQLGRHTSFVGVVKSIATITVGMLAFSDVMPTKLFVAGVVVNTFGSITYCVVKYQETRKKLNYQDMDESAKDEELPGEPYVEPAKPDGDMETLPNDLESVPNGSLTASVDGNDQGPIRENKVAESIELERPGIPSDDPTRQSLSDSYVGVWDPFALKVL